MNAIYYRDSDGKIIGSTSSPGRLDTDLELSHYGPGVSVLQTPSLPDHETGKIWKVVAGGLVKVADPDYDSMINRKRAAWDLIRQKIGLVDTQMELFFGRRP